MYSLKIFFTPKLFTYSSLSPSLETWLCDKQKGYRIDGREELLTILKSRPLLLQTNPAYKEWEARRIMKKVGRAKWWALVSDLNSNDAENGNKKATSLRYQPLYHAFLPYILPFLLCHSPFFLSFSLASSPFLFRQFCTRNLFSGRTLCSIHNTTKW